MVSENYIHISTHTYAVKNQNAFNQALYFEFGNKEDNTGLHTKEDLRDMIQSFPKTYPAVVIFHDNSFECSRIHVTVRYEEYCTQIRNKMDQALTKFKEWHQKG